MSFLPGLWRKWVNRSAAGPFLNAANLNDMELKFRALDCLGALRAISLVDAFPGSPADGDAYLTSATATPANKLVRRFDGEWESFTPINGMVAFLADGSAKQFTAGAWVDADFGGGVASVFGRTGAVVAQTGDYTAAQVGALPATDPVFTGALKQGATTRIAVGGGAWFASTQATNLVGAGDRPIAADLTGTIQPKTPDQFRNMISALSAALKGAANGVAELGADGRVPTTQLPSYVDDVLEYANFAAFPATGETGKIYVNLDQNRTWRWSGSAYVEISASLALGETSATAYRGDRGKTAYDHSQLTTGNPHGTTAADVGAAPAAHNHFSKLEVSASTTLGAIDASAIKVTTTDVILTLSGGVDGQGWDIINPTTSIGIAIPSGATLWKSIGSDVGPTTIALGGGRPIRITRIDANTWTMLGSQ